MIGDFNGAALEEFKACSQDACAEGMNIVLDMSQTGYIDPESLGSLIRLQSWMHRRREQLWLAELPRHLSRVLRTGRLHNYFMTTTMVSDALYRTAKAEQRLVPSFTPALGLNGWEASRVDVRVEMLQDVCRRIVNADETEESTLVPAAFASAGR